MNRTDNTFQQQSEQPAHNLATYIPLQDKIKQLSDQITTINTLLARQVKFSELLPSIAQLMPPGAVLEDLDFTTSDILNTTTPAAGAASGSATSATQKPFILRAAVKDRTVASTLLNNIKTSKGLFTDADIVSVNQATKGTSTDANATPSITVRYPYEVTINAYLKKINPQQSATSSQGSKTP
jgi:hypothetical protein